MSGMTIYKYPLHVLDGQSLTLPEGAQILSVAEQYNGIVLYAYVDPKSPETDCYTVRIHGTGHQIADITGFIFLGTCKLYDGRLMFHVFYKKEAAK